MHQGWLLNGVSLAYLGLLFLIAYVADKHKRHRLTGQPLLLQPVAGGLLHLLDLLRHGWSGE